MVNVLVVGLTNNPGGMESCVLNYITHIDNNVIHFDFLSVFEKIAFQDKFKKLNSSFFSVSKPSKQYLLYKRQLKKFFKENASKYDVLWLNTCSLSNIDYLKYAKKYGIHTRIIHAHNSQSIDGGLKDRLHKKHRKEIDKWANVFWSCSETASDFFFPASIKQHKYYKLINNAVDLNRLGFNNEERKKKRIELGLNNELVIGHVGRFMEQKNHRFLIRIFHSFIEKNPNTKLLLIGDGEKLDEIKSLVRELMLENNVLFLGVRDDISSLLSAMDIFIFPSLFEGLSIALVEAQASGLPCIVSDSISLESKMINQFYQVSLNDEIDAWTELLCSIKINTKDRIKAIKQIQNKDFDINLEAKKIQKLFQIYKGDQ